MKLTTFVVGGNEQYYRASIMSRLPTHAFVQN